MPDVERKDFMSLKIKFLKEKKALSLSLCASLVHRILSRQDPGLAGLDTHVSNEGPSPVSGKQALSILGLVKTKVS